MNHASTRVTRFLPPKVEFLFDGVQPLSYLAAPLFDEVPPLSY